MIIRKRIVSPRRQGKNTLDSEYGLKMDKGMIDN
jgi:hypothetical protein